MVESSVLREALERSGDSAGTIARRLGWLRANGKPDEGRVRYVIGVKNSKNHYRRLTGETTTYNTTAKQVRTSLAAQFVEACGFDPVDFDF